MAAPPLGVISRIARIFTTSAVEHSCSRRCRFRPRLLLSKRWSGVVRMGAVVGGGQEGQDEETRQAKEQAAARRRWEALIREQKIKTLTPREAGYAFKLTDKALLDVRPSNERQKAWVKGSTWIPVFDVDTWADLGGLSKKFTNFVMGGWWSGSSTLSLNKNFVQQVEEKFSKETDIILVCQKGLRSLAACEQLYNAGFENLFWVQGGLEAAEEEDFEREGPQPFKLAGIGGVSEFFGDCVHRGFYVGQISNEYKLRRRDWATGLYSQVAWSEHSSCWMLYFLALKGLALYSKKCSLIDPLIFDKCSFGIHSNLKTCCGMEPFEVFAVPFHESFACVEAQDKPPKAQASESFLFLVAGVSGHASKKP